MPSEGGSSYDIYSHKLRQRDDPKLKDRIDRLARRYERLRSADAHGSESARVRATYTELYGACLKYFYVTGSDLQGKAVDSILIDLLADAISRYDSSRGLLVHYIARVYPLRVRDEGERQSRAGKDVDSLDDGLLESSYDGRLAYSDEALELDPMESAESDEEESGTGKDSYLQFLSVLVSFLEHKEDGRHLPESKLYYRMVFVERIVYAVKSQELFDYCLPIERHERDTFAAMELGFLDRFMKEKARTVAALWSDDMQNGYLASIKRLRERIESFQAGGIEKPPKIRWIGIDSYKRYLEEVYGKTVSSPVISMQRDKFDRLEQQLAMT